MNDVVSWLADHTILIMIAIALITMASGAVYEMRKAKEMGLFGRAEGTLIHRGLNEMLTVLEWLDIGKVTAPMDVYFDVLTRMEAAARDEIQALTFFERLQARKSGVIDRYNYPDAGFERVDHQMAVELHEELTHRGLELPHPETCWLKRQCEDLDDKRLMATQALSVADSGLDYSVPHPAAQ